LKTCPKCKLTYPNERTFCFVDGTDLVALKDPRLGSTIAGRYVVEHQLGEGGMATVYAAHHTLVDRRCAIKIMNPMLSRDTTVRERFRREAKSAQKLAHPNVIEIFDQGETEDGTSYIVMEHLIGSSLAEVILEGKIPVPRAVGLMIQMARGIARAHDLDVIHRDLKPENIFVVRREKGGGDLIKLLDFGIARSLHDTRLTGQGELFGTPQYMAPERITSTDVGPSADLYALGIIFFEMVTGVLPFESPDIASFFVKHLKEIPRPPRDLNPLVPYELEDLILRLLAKEPIGRPVDAHRVHQDLVAIARQYGIAVPLEPQIDPAASSPRPPSTMRRLEPTRWVKRTELFEQMLSRVGGLVPGAADARSALDELKVLVRSLIAIGEETIETQRKLEQITERGRESRQRFGFAVDALGFDMSKAKGEERLARENLAAATEKVESSKASFLRVHREVTSWEGRSGFLQPYTDLAEAYRRAADEVDLWVLAVASCDAARSALEAATRGVSDIDFQVHALRTALATHERKMESAIEAHEITAAELTKEAESLDHRLGVIARSFCDPLRHRPELRPLFQALEAEAAA
jgi:eukaryotic-like serine/threonine-protein kinase